MVPNAIELGNAGTFSRTGLAHTESGESDKASKQPSDSSFSKPTWKTNTKSVLGHCNHLIPYHIMGDLVLWPGYKLSMTNFSNTNTDIHSIL